MTLSSYSINQQLINKFNQYLLQPHSFATLKSYLINNQPIIEIHQQIIQELSAIEASDQKHAEEVKIHEASEQQHTQDKREKEQDEREEQQQNLERMRLHTELILEISAGQQIEAELCDIRRLARYSSPLHTHPNTVQHIHQNRGTTLHTHFHTKPNPIPIDANVMRINQLEQSALFSKLRINEINNRLNDIQSQSQQRYIKKVQREARLQARSDLIQKKANVTVYDTLSISNSIHLQNSIRLHFAALKSTKDNLIAQAQQMNYRIYVQQLELSLNNLKLSATEIDALRHTIQSIKKYLERLAAAQTIQAQVNETNKNIETLRLKLKQYNSRVDELNNANPNLLQKNEQLITNNKELALTQQQNKNSRDKLVKPTWILAAISLFTSIPLFIALGGAFPMIAASVVLYTLVSVLPALSLLASLGTGGAALVFAIKERSNTNQIETNQKTIRTNQEQMGNNDVERLQLQHQTIPTYMTNINTSIQRKQELELSLKNTHAEASQSLEQAKATVPSLFEPLYPVIPQVHVEPVPPAYSFFKQPNIDADAPPAYYFIEPTAPPME